VIPNHDGVGCVRGVADPRPDHAALAREWLEHKSGFKINPTTVLLLNSLTALLERVAGEAVQGANEPQTSDEIDALADAQKEIEDLRNQIDRYAMAPTADGGFRFQWRDRAMEAEACIKSLSTMLGWENVPPQETLERNILENRKRLEKAEAAVEQARAEGRRAALKQMAKHFDGINTWLQGPDVSRVIRALGESEPEKLPLGHEFEQGIELDCNHWIGIDTRRMGERQLEAWHWIFWCPVCRAHRVSK